jgi:hypothetical protein
VKLGRSVVGYSVAGQGFLWGIGRWDNYRQFGSLGGAEYSDRYHLALPLVDKSKEIEIDKYSIQAQRKNLRQLDMLIVTDHPQYPY